jgi:hypothetical protein
MAKAIQNACIKNICWWSNESPGWRFKGLRILKGSRSSRSLKGSRSLQAGEVHAILKVTIQFSTWNIQYAFKILLTMSPKDPGLKVKGIFFINFYLSESAFTG